MFSIRPEDWPVATSRGAVTPSETLGALDSRPWLAFDSNLIRRWSFSPDSRYLAIGKSSGHITVFDLPALEEEIGAFEKTLPK